MIFFKRVDFSYCCIKRIFSSFGSKKFAFFDFCILIFSIIGVNYFLMKSDKPKIIVIVGQTSSGKTDLSVELAQKLNGEVVSADSRQVYKGLDIGSGKVTKTEMKGVPHYLIDVANPKSAFTISQFKKKADKVIKEILKKGRLPIVAGGTGFYIQALIDNVVLPEVKQNLKLRKELETKTVEELGKILKKLDKRRFEEIDQKNPRRIIRAIEIATELGKVPSLESPTPKYDVLEIGIKVADDVLKERIEKRFRKRVRAGIVAEAKKLREEGVSWKRMNEIGLAHKYIAKYLKGEIPRDEMVINSIKEEWKYAKRQKTWFKNDKRIKWFELKDKVSIFDEVKNFLNK